MHLLVSFWLSALLHLLHPFYISMTDVNYNRQEKSVEISVRIFTDDFENALRKHHPNVNIDIVHPASEAQMNDFVKAYIEQHLNLSVNNAPAGLRYVGYESQQESIWTYFEIENVTKLEQLTVNTSLLYDYSKEQSNIIHVSANGKEHTTKLAYPDKTAHFRFK